MVGVVGFPADAFHLKQIQALLPGEREDQFPARIMPEPGQQPERAAPVAHGERAFDGEIKDALPQNLQRFFGRRKHGRVTSHE